MNGDDKLHSILPLLRPRSAEPTLFTQVVWYLFWVGIAVLLALYIRRWLSHRRQRTREFQAAANAAGLTAEQTELLYSIARQQKMKSPPRLLSSPQVFDRQAGAYADIVVARNRHDPELAAIGQIRAALDFDDLDLEQSMSSTRQIDRGQTVMISVDRDTAEDELLYPWLVLERDEGALTLAPVLRAKGEPDLELRLGEEVTARFWREGDTEYQFVTKVLRRSRTEHSLDVRHASVEREQNRDFYRIDVDFPADFLLMSMQDPPAEGGAGVHSDAAINLLDLEGSETIRIDDSEDTGEDQEAGTTDVERLASAPRIQARVVNLSAGGLAIEVPSDQSAANEDATWVIDPAFEGQFPLASLKCVPVSSDRTTAGNRRIKMRFDELPLVAEKEIVRGVYEHQLQAAGGRGQPAATDAARDAAPVEEDDLPTS